MAELPEVSFSEIVKGVREAVDAISAMEDAVDAASLTALKASQRAAKTSVKSGMRGAPRWSQRGPIRVGGLDEPGVNTGRSPVHVARSGGPGSLTGHLRNAVGVVRSPKKLGREWHGGIGVGGPRSVTQVYRTHVSGKYPFIQPGVTKAEPKMAAAYKAAWAKATET